MTLAPLDLGFVDITVILENYGTAKASGFLALLATEAVDIEQKWRFCESYARELGFPECYEKFEFMI